MARQTSAIVVNWNGARFLTRLLESLRTEQVARTIVVDNASTDDSIATLRSFPDVQLISNKENVGFGIAANQAIESSTTRFVMILNVDVEIQPGAIDKLEDFLSGREDVAVAAPQLIYPDGTLQPSCRKFPTILTYSLFLSYLDYLIPCYRLSKKQHRATREVDQPMGAALLIRKAALDDAGYFDPRFSLYMEDVDLCERLKRRGWRLFYVPDARVIHYAGGSTDQDWQASQTLYFENAQRYFQKKLGNRRMLLMKSSFSIALIFRSFANLAVGRLQRSAFYFKTAIRMLTNKVSDGRTVAATTQAE